MTPTTAASLIREAARGWTSAELVQFCFEIEDLTSTANERDLDARYDEGYADGKSAGHDDGYADGYADAEGEAEAAEAQRMSETLHR